MNSLGLHFAKEEKDPNGHLYKFYWFIPPIETAKAPDYKTKDRTHVVLGGGFMTTKVQRVAAELEKTPRSYYLYIRLYWCSLFVLWGTY